MCFLYTSINIKDGMKALKAETQPDACKEIAQDAKTFQGFFLDCVCYCSTEADAGHEQKIPVVDAAKVNSADLTIDKDITGTCYIHWYTCFMRPGVEGATRNETQGRFTSGQSLDNRVYCTISANGNDYICFLHCRFASQSLCIITRFCELGFDVPTLLT